MKNTDPVKPMRDRSAITILTFKHNTSRTILNAVHNEYGTESSSTNNAVSCPPSTNKQSLQHRAIDVLVFRPCSGCTFFPIMYSQQRQFQFCQTEFVNMFQIVYA